MQHPELPGLCHTAGSNRQRRVQKQLLTVAPLNVKGLRHKRFCTNFREEQKEQETTGEDITYIHAHSGGRGPGRGQRLPSSQLCHSCAPANVLQVGKRSPGALGSARLQQAAGRKTSRLFGQRLSGPSLSFCPLKDKCAQTTPR